MLVVHQSTSNIFLEQAKSEACDFFRHNNITGMS